MSEPNPQSVGIDVVDCFERRMRGKAGDDRFVARVFSPDEAKRIRSAHDPDLLLWLMWAAKEAVFKAETVALGEPPVFDHSTFVVSVPDQALSFEYPPEIDLPAWRPVVSGTVLRSGVEIPVEWSVTGGVTCITPPSTLAHVKQKIGVESLSGAAARLGAPKELSALIQGHFQEAESRAMHSLPSGLARLAAREAAVELMGIESERIRIVTPPGPAGRTPPHLEVDGQRDPRVALSISHHGDRIAWVVRVTSGRAGS